LSGRGNLPRSDDGLVEIKSEAEVGKRKNPRALQRSGFVAIINVLSQGRDDSMSIISHVDSVGSTRPKTALPHALIFGVPFCDYLNVSVPRDSGDLVMFEARPLLDLMGLSQVAPGLFREGRDGGTFKHSQRGKVAIFGASGGLLDLLRRRGEFSNYLSVFSGFPHRVTMLHATADYAVDGPPAVARARRHGRRGLVSLTRKRVTPSAVKAILSLDVSGRSTGTIYFGHRQNADVWAKVYDKRHERLCRGLSDPGPMVRVEVAVQSDVGATLRDAFNPSALFFHHASPSLVEAPPCGREWSAHGEGFTVTKREHEPYAAQRIRAILDTSLDVGRICQIAREAFGTDAGLLVGRMMAKRFEQKALI
jgi:hypothetical protein